MILPDLPLASAIRGAAPGVALEEYHRLLCLPKRLRRKPEFMCPEHSNPRRREKKHLYYPLNLMVCKSISWLQSRLDWGMKPMSRCRSARGSTREYFTLRRAEQHRQQIQPSNIRISHVTESGWLGKGFFGRTTAPLNPLMKWSLAQQYFIPSLVNLKLSYRQAGQRGPLLSRQSIPVDHSFCSPL